MGLALLECFDGGLVGGIKEGLRKAFGQAFKLLNGKLDGDAFAQESMQACNCLILEGTFWIAATGRQAVVFDNVDGQGAGRLGRILPAAPWATGVAPLPAEF